MPIKPDAIPVHLLTEGAFATYADKLAPGGVLAVHICNRVFDLEPVVSNAAHRLGWQAALGIGKATRWRNNRGVNCDVSGPVEDRRARHVDRVANRHVRWTDNYSSVLTVLKAPG